MMMKKIFLLTLLLGFLSVNVCAETLPKLVDVGADKCIPCIKMAPILDQLGEDYAGQMEVKFVDACC
jgi:thioredoxin 1